jgi:hypothetical protein
MPTRKKYRYQPSSKILERPLESWMLPIVVERPLAAKFAGLSTRTLQRAERAGLLTPIKRNERVVCYLRSELLSYLGAPPEREVQKSNQ